MATAFIPVKGTPTAHRGRAAKPSTPPPTGTSYESPHGTGPPRTNHVTAPQLDQSEEGEGSETTQHFRPNCCKLVSAKCWHQASCSLSSDSHSELSGRSHSEFCWSHPLRCRRWHKDICIDYPPIVLEIVRPPLHATQEAEQHAFSADI